MWGFMVTVRSSVLAFTPAGLSPFLRLGLGLGCAEALAEAGVNLLMNARGTEALEAEAGPEKRGGDFGDALDAWIQREEDGGR